MTDRIAVYSVLIGPYDDVPPAPYGGILFTDQDVQPEGWEVQRVERPHPNQRYASRWFLCHSCQLLPDYEYTISHNANGRLRQSPETLVSYLPDGVDIACFVHPLRRNVYQEAQACIKMAKDRRQVIEAQMARYRAGGFPASVTVSCCVLLIRRNTPRLARFEALWWDEIKQGSWRNQLSFDYCLWKLRMKAQRMYRFDVQRAGIRVPRPVLEIVKGHRR